MVDRPVVSILNIVNVSYDVALITVDIFGAHPKLLTLYYDAVTGLTHSLWCCKVNRNDQYRLISLIQNEINADYISFRKFLWEILKKGSKIFDILKGSIFKIF